MINESVGSQKRASEEAKRIWRNNQSSVLRDELSELNQQIELLENALEKRKQTWKQLQLQQQQQQQQSPLENNNSTQRNLLLRKNSLEFANSLRNESNQTNIAREEREEIFRIRSLLSFTGLRFTKTSNEIISGSLTNNNNNNYQENVTRRFKMHGISFDIPFELEFDVVEQSQQTQQILLQQNQQPHPWISSLKVHCSERPDVETLLSPFFRSLETTKSLKHFFSVFTSFCQISLERFELFEKFRLKYPNLISIPNGRLGAAMIFSFQSNNNNNNNNNRQQRNNTLIFYEFAVVWDLIVVNEEIRPELKQTITLHPQFDQLSLPEEDENFSLLLKLPSMFATLVKLNGLEYAIQVVIDCSIMIE